MGQSDNIVGMCERKEVNLMLNNLYSSSLNTRTCQGPFWVIHKLWRKSLMGGGIKEGVEDRESKEVRFKAYQAVF